MARSKKTAGELEPTIDDERDDPAAQASALDAGIEDGPDDDEALLDDVRDVAASMPVTAESRESARRLVALLLEKEMLALHASPPSAALLDAIARALDWPGPPSRQASLLSSALVDSDDVDELFVGDEVLVEILKRW